MLAVNGLALPRYGLGNYLKTGLTPTSQQVPVIDGLSRAGSRLMGFCRTNLFKRLESVGPAFLLSIERHILRNHVVLHALENGRDIPLGAQGAELLDTRYHDEDIDENLDGISDEKEENGKPESLGITVHLRTETDYRSRAAEVYAAYAGPLQKRFKWLPAGFFKEDLTKHLEADAKALINVLDHCGEWNPTNDAKLNELVNLIEKKTRQRKAASFHSIRRYLALSQGAACGTRHPTRRGSHRGQLRSHRIGLAVLAGIQRQAPFNLPSPFGRGAGGEGQSRGRTARPDCHRCAFRRSEPSGLWNSG